MSSEALTDGKHGRPNPQDPLYNFCLCQLLNPFPLLGKINCFQKLERLFDIFRALLKRLQDHLELCSAGVAAFPHALVDFPHSQHPEWRLFRAHPFQDMFHLVKRDRHILDLAVSDILRIQLQCLHRVLRVFIVKFKWVDPFLKQDVLECVSSPLCKPVRHTLHQASPEAD